MKIISLRFKNLNSLYGEWAIDFTNDEFVANGIFAITGQTGAGKSTILDAICLALYGETPRLGKIAGDVNNLMSRHTSDCSSEVVFETTKGQFIASWSQRRARNSVDGNLQEYKHEIAHMNGELIENKRSLVADKIVEITGMDFKRFTKSMLLAQGGFDTFLKAPTEEKSKILEQITGTEIYSIISKQVFETTKIENQKYETLLQQISGIEILTQEGEGELLAQIAAGEAQKKTIDNNIKQLYEIKNWHERINNLKNDISIAENELVQIAAKQVEFAPQKHLLEQARKAQDLEADYINLSNLRTQIQKYIERMDAIAGENEKFELLEKGQKDMLVTANENHQATSKRQNELEPIIIKTIELDARITQQNEALQKSQNALQPILAEIELKMRQNADLKLDIKNHQTTLKDIVDYLEKHKNDANLGAQIGVFEKNSESIWQTKTRIKDKNARLIGIEEEKLNAVKNRNDAQLNLETLVSEEKAVNEKINKENIVLTQILAGRTRREIEIEKEGQKDKKTIAQLAHSLNDHRKALVDGKPCPLCGALEHPLVNENLPKENVFDIEITKLTSELEKIDALQGQINTLEKQKLDLERAANLARGNMELLNAQILNHEKIIAEINEEVTGEINSLEKFEFEFAESIKYYGIKADETALETLKQRNDIWQKNSAEFQALQNQISVKQAQLSGFENELKDKNIRLQNAQSEHSKIEENLKKSQYERKELFGDKSPIFERERLQQLVGEAGKMLTNANLVLHDTHQKIQHNKNEISRINQEIEKLHNDKNDLETSFFSALETKGFETEESLAHALLDKKTRDGLEQKSQELNTAEIKFVSLKKSAEEKIAHELSIVPQHFLNGDDLEITNQKIANTEAEFDEIIQNLTALNVKFNENEKAKNLLKDKQEAIEKQKNECAKWQKLNTLIGSADGKKFRNFAQGLTFDIMVAHANQELIKMSERYLLARDIGDNKNPLELNVIDNFQAGQVRPVKNLSGGESFLISLALALGLSKMASSKVRVDSLFLDEGFGTLDEETLEIALETLSRLHQDGKLIGVISHVSALKEKITTQIQVTPISGGRSKLSGAGVRSI